MTQKSQEAQDKQPEPQYWYAMGSPYGKETKISFVLENKDQVETFLPLMRVERMVGQYIRKRKVELRPVVPNLLFVKSTEANMRSLKEKYNSMLQFKVCRRDGAFYPIIVPDKQMEDFMCLYNHVDESQRMFFNPDDIVLRANAKVKIEDGIFAGVEGYYQQVRSKTTKKGTREKCFVVKIEGFLACAAFLTECNYVSCSE